MIRMHTMVYTVADLEGFWDFKPLLRFQETFLNFITLKLKFFGGSAMPLFFLVELRVF